MLGRNRLRYSFLFCVDPPCLVTHPYDVLSVVKEENISSKRKGDNFRARYHEDSAGSRRAAMYA